MRGRAALRRQRAEEIRLGARLPVNLAPTLFQDFNVIRFLISPTESIPHLFDSETTENLTYIYLPM